MGIANIDNIGADGIGSKLAADVPAGSDTVTLPLEDASLFPADGTDKFITISDKTNPGRVIDWFTGWTKNGNSLEGCTRGKSANNGASAGDFVQYGVNFKWLENMLAQLATMESDISDIEAIDQVINIQNPLMVDSGDDDLSFFVTRGLKQDEYGDLYQSNNPSEDFDIISDEIAFHFNMENGEVNGITNTSLPADWKVTASGNRYVFDLSGVSTGYYCIGILEQKTTSPFSIRMVMSEAINTGTPVEPDVDSGYVMIGLIGDESNYLTKDTTTKAVIRKITEISEGSYSPALASDEVGFANLPMPARRDVQLPTQDMAAGDDIYLLDGFDCYNVQGDGGFVIITKTPSIIDGLYDGQIITIAGVSDSNFVVLQDEVNLPGSNLLLGGTDIVLTQGTWIKLRFDSDSGKWHKEALPYLAEGRGRTYLADDTGYIDIPANTWGWGSIQIGDNEEFARFRWSEDGTVVFDTSTSGMIETDTNTYFCIFDNGTNIRLRNRLGSPKDVKYVINY